MLTKLAHLAAAVLVALHIWPAKVRHHLPHLHPLPPLFVTGYDDYGLTATGTQARPGVCAVDPRLIPLGAYVHVNDLGTCHAEDTGGDIVGARLDWWFPTAGQCYAVTGTYEYAYWWKDGQ